ncbi:MAG: glycosyltransferase family 2 protein [Bacteroidota bacterium]
MNLDQITPVILTYNERENISRTMNALHWAKQIIIIDSFSSDETLEIVGKYQDVTVYQREFDTHENQWNYGLDKVKTEWVLSLDADYLVTEKLFREMEKIDPTKADGFLIPFKYCVNGKPLRSTVLPPRITLFRKDKAKYVNDGHTQRLRIKGDTPLLENHILHDDRKPLSRWLWAQDRYMKLEVEKLFSGKKLSWPDRIRKKIFLAPILIFFYCLFFKRGLLDGKRGWYYAYQRMLAECLLSLRIIEYRFGKRD